MEKPSVPKLLRHTRGCRRLVSVDIDDVREICSIVWVVSFARAREMCSATKDEVRGSVWSLWLCPRHPQSAWTRRERYTVPWTASNTSQYSGSGRGSQPPEGGMLLRIPGRVTRKSKSTPNRFLSSLIQTIPLKQKSIRLK